MSTVMSFAFLQSQLTVDNNKSTAQLGGAALYYSATNMEGGDAAATGLTGSVIGGIGVKMLLAGAPAGATPIGWAVCGAGLAL